MAICRWAEVSQLDRLYHDQEWGVPEYDETRLFELLTLEGAEAGLSWSIILRKREGYRKAFAQFDVDRVARFTAKQVERLVLDPSIVRHRGKISSVIENAKAVLRLRDEGMTLGGLLWDLAGGTPRTNRWKVMEEVPASTPESTAMSKALKKRGFGFVGPTTCYALMQAAGMVNDHLIGCFRHREVSHLNGCRPNR